MRARGRLGEVDGVHVALERVRLGEQLREIDALGRGELRGDDEGSGPDLLFERRHHSPAWRAAVVAASHIVPVRAAGAIAPRICQPDYDRDRLMNLRHGVAGRMNLDTPRSLAGCTGLRSDSLLG